MADLGKLVKIHENVPAEAPLPAKSVPEKAPEPAPAGTP